MNIDKLVTLKELSEIYPKNFPKFEHTNHQNSISVETNPNLPTGKHTLRLMTLYCHLRANTDVPNELLTTQQFANKQIRDD